MTNPERKYWIVELSCPAADGPRAIQAMENLGALGNYEILWEKDNPAFGLAAESTAQLEFFFTASTSDAQLNLAAEILQATSDQPDLYTWTLSLLGDRDFERAYRRHFEPIEVPPYAIIIPPWKCDEFREHSQPYAQHGTPAAAARANGQSLPIVIQPAMAFGTGAHETTRLCMAYLSERWQDGPTESILDMGTGSGILALWAALHGHRCLGVDVSELAVHNAGDNRQLNAQTYPSCTALAEPSLQFMVGDFESEAIYQGPFDFFMGNLTAAILTQNLDAIRRIPVQQGIFSGVLAKFGAELKAKMTQAGFTIHTERELDDWLLWHWTKP